jgi:hypothetical protein
VIPAPLIFLPLVVEISDLTAERTEAETIALIPVPPVRYMGAANAAVHFADPETVTQLCGGAPEGKLLIACATKSPPQMALPNPCLFLHEQFARIACHEKAHILGWPAEHGP